MSRFASAQPDLFAPPVAQPAATPPQPEPDPLVELQATLERLQATDVMPWATITAAMQEEYRVMHLARVAGAAGQALAAAIFEHTERLLATTD